MPDFAGRLFARIQSREARVGVVGLGYVGLPLAVEFANGGLTTIGIDLDSRKVAAIQNGDSYIPDVPASDVRELVAAGHQVAALTRSSMSLLNRRNRSGVCCWSKFGACRLSTR